MRRTALFLAFVALVALLLSSCVSQGSHSFGHEWKYDENSHWRICVDEGCEEISGLDTHLLDSGKIDVAKETKTYSCTVCKYQKTVDYAANTRIDDEGWNEAVGEGAFDGARIDVKTSDGENVTSVSIGYGDKWVYESTQIDGGKEEVRYYLRTAMTDTSIDEMAKIATEWLSGQYDSFAYSVDTKRYTGAISLDGNDIELTCGFADGNLIYLAFVDGGISYEIEYSGYGSITAEPPFEDLRTQYESAVRDENFDNVTASGSHRGSVLTVLIEDAYSSGKPRMNDIVSDLRSVDLDKLSELITVDGAVTVITLTGDDGASTKIRISDGRIGGFISGDTSLAFFDYGSTKDGEISEGVGAENETPLIPK